MMVSQGGEFMIIYFSNPGGRLTTESGVPVSTTDRASQGTLYYTPYKHNIIFTYSGALWQGNFFSEISLSLSLTSGKNYDIFINTDADTLSLSSAWTNDTTRADALGTQDGVIVLGSDHTKLWLGTIRASGTDVTEDSAGGSTTQVGGKRFVWNAYNQVARRISVIDTTDNWSYATATIRQANGASGNKVEYVSGDAAMQIDATMQAGVLIVADATNWGRVGIGVDSTSTFSGLFNGFYNPSGSGIAVTAGGEYVGTPGLGYHYVSWNEKGAPAGSVSVFIGDDGGIAQSGLIVIGEM